MVISHDTPNLIIDGSDSTATLAPSRFEQRPTRHEEELVEGRRLFRAVLVLVSSSVAL